LLSASILTTQRENTRGQGDFAKNLRLTSTLLGLTIFLTLASLNGNLEKSEMSLAQAITSRANRTEQAFAWCALAEMAVRRGDLESAETRFRKSLELEPENSYTLAADCDLLMALGRHNEAVGAS
jgi:Flp pilus assembly protein TadD